MTELFLKSFSLRLPKICNIENKSDCVDGGEGRRLSVLESKRDSKCAWQAVSCQVINIPQGGHF